MDRPISDEDIKYLEMLKLMPYAGKKPSLLKFFDANSRERLDEKIEILTAIKEGKTISEIPNFWDLYELLPKDGQMWD